MNQPHEHDCKARHNLSGRASLALSVVAVMVAMSGTAIAATGGPFILGRNNAETTTAVLTNTEGTPLSLAAKAGHAPLAVNSTVKVPRLNADLLDGINSSGFLRTAGTASNSDRLDGIDSSQFVRKTGNRGVEESFANTSLYYSRDLIGFFVVPPGSWSLTLYSNIASQLPDDYGSYVNDSIRDYYGIHRTVVCSLIDSNLFYFTVYHSVGSEPPTFYYSVPYHNSGAVWSTLNFTTAINYPTGTLLTLRCGVEYPDGTDSNAVQDEFVMHATRITAVEVSGFTNGHP